ncbi:MAG: sigma-70 family RNA polymerase sigma factor, partial [Muribaculaceae bacterium]
DNISVSEYDFDLEIDVERTIINAEYKRDLADTLQKAMSKLTGKQKEIIYLKYYKGMSNSEMVIATGLNIQTVKNLASQAISRLREIKELANVYAPFLLLVILLILSL